MTALTKLCNDADRVAVEATLDALELTHQWSGLNVWIDDQPAATKANMQLIGARWSEKRGAWYIRAEESYRNALTKDHAYTRRKARRARVIAQAAQPDCGPSYDWADKLDWSSDYE